MICPICNTAYDEGTLTCLYCNITLPNNGHSIEGSKPTPIEEIEYVEVLHVSDFTVLALIKSLFDASGIRYFFWGEQMMNAGVMSGGGPARLFVAAEDESSANELLSTLRLEEC